MPDELRVVLDGGPAAILDAAAARAPLNWGVLAQACARRAYAAVASSPTGPAPGADASGWAEATIVSYDTAAAEISEAFTRQGLECIGHAWRTTCILNRGLGDSRARAYLAESVAWVEAGIAAFLGPESFRRRLYEDDPSESGVEAFLLRERLQAVSTLWRAGVFPAALDEWFYAAGIRGPLA